MAMKVRTVASEKREVGSSSWETSEAKVEAPKIVMPIMRGSRKFGRDSRGWVANSEAWACGWWAL
jgi:hypothetical protein